MKTRLFHIGAGDILGVVLDVITGNVNGLIAGAMYLATINGDQSQNYSRFFGEADTQFNFEPLLIQFEVESATGILSVPAISIGTNSPDYNNVLTAMTLTGLSVVGAHTVVFPSAGSMEAMYGTDIYVNVTSVGIGTELTLSVDLIGTYQP